MDKKKIKQYKAELEHMLKKEKKKKSVKIVEFFNEERIISPRETTPPLENVQGEEHQQAPLPPVEQKQAPVENVSVEQKASPKSVVSDIATVVEQVAIGVAEVAHIVADMTKSVLPEEKGGVDDTKDTRDVRVLNFKCSPPDRRDFIVVVKEDYLKAKNAVSAQLHKIASIIQPPIYMQRINDGRRRPPPPPQPRPPPPPPPIVKDLSKWCSSVKDQGHVGSCTAFSFIGLMEYNYNKYASAPSGEQDIFSEKFLYYITRVKVENQAPTQDDGAYIRDVLKASKIFGVCKEISCPYYTNGKIEYYAPPSDNMYDEAQKFQILQYARVDERNMLATCKVLIDNERPFVGGFLCYENLHENVRGQIPLPKGRICGGHAVLFVGYDDNKKLLKFKNSWGVNWGDNGYGYLPYHFMERGLVQDVWTVYKQEHEDKAIGVNKPTDI